VSASITIPLTPVQEAGAGGEKLKAHPALKTLSALANGS